MSDGHFGPARGRQDRSAERIRATCQRGEPLDSGGGRGFCGKKAEHSARSGTAPSLPAVLADATSYAERLYDYKHLDLLNDQETRRALVEPAVQRQVVWDIDALTLAVASTGGYPYFVQACGKHVWRVRTEERRITLEDAQLGVERARTEVDRGLYQSRWERATPAQRDVMRAMADDNGAKSAIQDLVIRTGKSRTSDLSVSRRELIRNGHVYAPDRGFIAFTVPGMADYIHRKVMD